MSENGQPDGNGKLRRAKVENVTIVGGGAIGKEVLRDICQDGLAKNITVWNKTAEKSPKQLAEIRCFVKALDQKLIAQGKLTPKITFLAGDQELGNALEGANVVVVTAGAKREEAKPGQKELTRDDLLNLNRGFIEQLAPHAKRAAKDASWILAPNPLDTLTQSFHEKSGVPANQVVGISSDLDSARFVQAICEQFNIPRGEENEENGVIRNIVKNAHIIGAHNDTMVPLVSQVTIQLQENGPEVSLKDFAADYATQHMDRVQTIIDKYSADKKKLEAFISAPPPDTDPERLKADKLKLGALTKTLDSWDKIEDEKQKGVQVLLDDIAQTTIKGGEYFVQQQGYSDYIAPGEVVTKIVKEVIHNKAYPDKEKQTIFCSVQRENGVFIGGPVQFNGNGTHSIVPLEDLGINKQEQIQFAKSEQACEKKMADLDVMEKKGPRELKLVGKAI